MCRIGCEKHATSFDDRGFDGSRGWEYWKGDCDCFMITCLYISNSGFPFAKLQKNRISSQVELFWTMLDMRSSISNPTQTEV